MALPVEAMVTYSITLRSIPDAFVPPPKTPRVVEESAPACLLVADQFPKSEALPVFAMVT